MTNLMTVLRNLIFYSVILFVAIQILARFFDFASKKLIKVGGGKKKLLLAAVGGFALVLPLLLAGEPYILRTSVMVLLYIVLALSLNIVLGQAGQLSLGHAAFYALGAYTMAILTVSFGVNFWIALVAGGVVAGVFGFVLGIPTLRLKGDYLAIVTVGFGEILRLILINWGTFTRGPAGIPGIPSPSFFGMVVKGNTGYYYIILVMVVFTIIVSKRLEDSRLGRGLAAVKDDEIAAESMGVNPANMKILAFVLGAVIAGFAGGFFASFVHYVNPDNFTYMESVTILTMVVLGGLGSIPGVIVGAVILAILPEALRDISTYRYAIYGILLAMMMIIRPQGMISLDSLKRRSAADENPRGIWNFKSLWRSNGR